MTLEVSALKDARRRVKEVDRFTPGPWQHPDITAGSVWTADGKAQIATTRTLCEGNLDSNFSPIKSEEAKANAILIAAAPDLLAALMLALPHVPDGAVHPVRVHTEPMADCLLRDIIEAAIAKATAA